MFKTDFLFIKNDGCTKRGLLESVFLSVPVALIPSLFLYFFAHLMGSLIVNVDDIEAPARDSTAMTFLGVVLVAPFVETALLGTLAYFISKTKIKQSYHPVVLALGFGSLHAAIGPLWFFGTVWSFYIFAIMFLNWIKRSIFYALISALLPHILINAAVLIIGHLEY